MRRASRVSLRYCGKGDVEETDTSHITGDLIVELGMMCTDENDMEELNELHASLCWQRYDRDPGGF